LQAETPSLQTPFLVFSLLILTALVIGGLSYMRLSNSFYKQKDELRKAHADLKKAARWQRKYIRMRRLAQKNEGILRAMKSGLLASKSCLYSVEVEGKKIKFGKNVDDVLGLEPGQAKAMNLTNYDVYASYVHPDDLAMVNLPIEERALGNAKNLYQYQYRLLLPTGMKWIKSSGEVIFRIGKPHRVVGFIQDVTELMGGVSEDPDLIVG